VGAKAAISKESILLAGLSLANQRMLGVVQQPVPQRIATLDAFATTLETHKRTVSGTYEGTQGYQPVRVVWIE
jgi:hypothetical protein